MVITLTNPDFPHFAEITRSSRSDEPPFTSTDTVIWSGAVDCQISGGGGTGLKEAVFVSDYTIYSACIDSELQAGDLIAIKLTATGTPINCTIEQSSTEDVWEVDGVKYGTTIWANAVKS